MPIEITCSGCGKPLRVPDNAGGKRVKCPACQTILSVPGAAGAPRSAVGSGMGVAGSGVRPVRYHLKTEDGQTFGPVPKHELDVWLSEGRITAECQLLQEGGDQWQWATDLYPQLQGQPAGPAPAATFPGGFPDSASDNPFAFAAADHSPVARATGLRGGSGSVNVAEARRKVQAPAILLIVTGVIGLLLHLASVPLNLANMAEFEAAGGQHPSLNPPVIIFSAVVGLVFDGIVIFGGLQMKSLRSWGLALTASIFALIPFCVSCGCLVGLPAGIWAMVVLNDNMVKAAFR